MQKFRLVMVALTALTLVIGNTAFAQSAAQQTPTQICEGAVPADEPASRTFAAPEAVLEAGVDYRAVFCTDAGAIYIDLFESAAPITVNNFVFLAEQGYYNNTTFHRVLESFMAQGGDPTGTGSGGPGYNFVDEFVGFLTFDQPGWLAMANAGPGTNGSQFFITTVPTPHLDFNHTIFGQVIEGQENVNALQLRDPSTATTPGASLQTVVIITDPSLVETTHVSPAPVTSEEIDAVINQIASELPSALGTDPEKSGISTADEIVALAPEASQEALTALFADNNFEFRGAVEVENVQCDLNASPFYALGYTLDAYATAADATAAIATAADENGALYQLALAEGYVPLEATTSLPYPIFIRTAQACDQQASQALTYWQRGRFIAIAEALYPADAQVTADIWLGEVVGIRIFEQLFTDILRTTLN